MNLKNYEMTHDILNPDGNSNLRPFDSRAGSWLQPVQLFSSPLLEILFRFAILGLVLLSVASITRACGPDFPNNLLDSGDEALLVAPLANFTRELERLKLATSRFDHVSATNGYEHQTCDAEMADLTAALKKAKVSDEESARIVEGHQLNRRKLSDFLGAVTEWEAKPWLHGSDGQAAKTESQPIMPGFDEVSGLPGEFADYFEGAVAFQNSGGVIEVARTAWERLLSRPASERKFKSTWAAFMLGKSWEGEDDDKAIEYYQQVRSLAKKGFADSTGLAAASLGWEAKIYYERGEYQKAIALYLEQLAAGDSSAAESLRLTASAALGNPGQLRELALNSDARQVITAFLVSCRSSTWSYATEEQKRSNETVVGWLKAIEAAEVKDLELGEKLALAAYQGGAFEEAQRWIKRAGNSSLAQWLQAKLYLREGKVAQAAPLLANVSRNFPLELSATNAPERFTDNLFVVRAGSFEGISVGQQVLGEWGAVQLGRREFVEALDALLRAGFWPDAAYVAERVLTADELKIYVDRNWPSQVLTATRVSDENAEEEGDTGDTPREGIRYLLARRLTRELRSGEAREYYPVEWQPKFDELVVALDQGWNEGGSIEQRARGLFTSALIARTNGMELLGTELAPDWFIHGGNFESGLTWEGRADSSAANRANAVTAEELKRAGQHRADPEARFHYRYQAAFLAWEAAMLLPDNSDETARVLCTAGTWLKNRDPETADIFYKSLVKRCRKTAIGGQADRMRWFPVLDDKGEPISYRPRLETAKVSEAAATSDADNDNSNDFPIPGSTYVVHRGDTLAIIAKFVGVTVTQIVGLNPGLEAARLRVGQRIQIPEATSEAEATEDRPSP